MDYEIIIFFTVIFICGGIFGLLGIAALILACFKKRFNVSFFRWLETTHFNIEARTQLKNWLYREHFDFIEVINVLLFYFKLVFLIIGILNIYYLISIM